MLDEILSSAADQPESWAVGQPPLVTPSSTQRVCTRSLNLADSGSVANNVMGKIQVHAFRLFIRRVDGMCISDRESAPLID
eukprot:599807-Pelagomonas_calceolata.AAC.1